MRILIAANLDLGLALAVGFEAEEMASDRLKQVELAAVFEKHEGGGIVACSTSPETVELVVQRASADPE